MKKIYRCECGNEICSQTAIYGSGRCHSCDNRVYFKENPEIFKGENNPNYKGGITSLTHIIRNSDEYKRWQKQVFERDNYTCQECNQYGNTLNVHHEKPFSHLLSEFLQEYNQFSPIEDKETLVRLAINWKPFWDVDNGKTLCKKCHNKISTRR